MGSLPLAGEYDEDPCSTMPATEGRAALLVVADEPVTRSFLAHALRGLFAHVECVADAPTARSLAGGTDFDLLIADMRLPGSASGLELTMELRGRAATPPHIILLAEVGELPERLDNGADDAVEILTKPLQIEQLRAMVERVRARREGTPEAGPADRRGDRRPLAARIIGESDTIKEIWRTIRRIAPMPSTVLINGETGTGKELVARALHELSGRRGCYVPVNCGAISPDLIEGELFGHLRGAFTGAHQTRNGLFGHADGGTLFLDEIGEMPLALQAKLLRVLEEKSYRPVGGNQEIPVNARVIAATNRDLAAEVLAGRFRKDLYYRINVVEIRLPPLRERRQDIPRLARFFLDVLSAELGVSTPALDAAEMGELVRYDWPGNIRELRNLIERALLLGEPPSQLLAGASATGPAAEAGKAPMSTPLPPRSLEDLQRAHILNALIAAGGNKTLAARHLGVSRKTVERKLKEWAETGVLTASV